MYKSKKGCTLAQIEKELWRERKGWELSSLCGGRRKRGVQLRRREDMTGLFLARHANNFLSARKAGHEGGGQINSALKILLQEIVVFFNEGFLMACSHHAE